MNWNSWGELLAMGGYGLYVWGAFGVVAACMGAEALAVWRRHRRALAQGAP